MQKRVGRMPHRSPEKESCIMKWYLLKTGEKKPTNLNIIQGITVHSKMFRMFKTIHYTICLVVCEAAYYSRRNHQKMVLYSNSK